MPTSRRLKRRLTSIIGRNSKAQGNNKGEFDYGQQEFSERVSVRDERRKGEKSLEDDRYNRVGFRACRAYRGSYKSLR